ncbi:sulfotransferase [Abyssibacter sp.]|uniref:sulfotransferase family protein n=1 Tax=Abyssibacter sp. TaxID=2320200 RepID=UPI0035175060
MAEYANWLSRVLLAQQFANQHLVSLDVPPWRTAAIRMVSRALRPSIDDIEIKAPIFIVGTPRCGSTMMQEILSCHERVAYVTHAMDSARDPRTFYATELLRKRLKLDVEGERYLKDSIIVNAGTPAEAMRFWAEALKLDPFALTWPDQTLDDFTPEDIEHIYFYIKHVINCFRDRGGDRFLNKSPALLTVVPLVAELFPDARFIYLVRDGRQVANSLIKLYRRQREQDIKVNHPMFKDQPFIPYPRVNGLEQAIETWGAEDLRTTSHIWNESIDYMDRIKSSIPHLMEVRYEDVLAEPQAVVGQILEFCELGEPEQPGAKAAFDARMAKVGRVSHVNQYSGFEIVESIAGENLKRYGYCDSSS